MIGLKEKADDILTTNPGLTIEIAQSIAMAAESICQTLGDNYAGTIQNSIDTTTFKVGGKTEYKIEFDLGTKTCTQTVIVRRDHDDNNPNHNGEFVSSIVGSICDHPRFEGDRIVTNRGLGTTTYIIEDGKLVECAPVGMGLQKGFEDWAIEKTMRDNYNDDYTTTGCVHQKAGCEWLIEHGLRDPFITSGLTGDRTPLTSAIASINYDIDELLNSADELMIQNEKRSLPDSNITPETLAQTYMNAFSSLAETINRTLTEEKDRTL